jgi:hypothetical protein
LGPEHQGRYFFADFIQGRCWSLGLGIDPGSGEARTVDVVEHTAELGDVGNISSFGVDADGELYIVSYSQGIVYRMSGAPTAPATPANPRISRE